MFEYAEEGREGTFLALSAAPAYIGMGLSGYLSGWLLSHYYSETRKDTDYIWITLCALSGTSLILLILFRPCLYTRRAAPHLSSSDSDDDLKAD